MKMSNVFRSKFILAACIALGAMMVSCSTMTKAERDAKNAERAKYVTKVLDSKHYTIDIDMMHANRFGSQFVRDNWSLEVKGDTLVSYLPYVGVAHSAPIGSDSGFNFTAPIKSYEDKGVQKGKRSILVSVTNDGDMIEYHLDVMENGNTSVFVTSRKRESISYSGQISEE